MISFDLRSMPDWKNITISLVNPEFVLHGTAMCAQCREVLGVDVCSGC
jgi:hypothetical protein